MTDLGNNGFETKDEPGALNTTENDDDTHQTKIQHLYDLITKLHTEIESLKQKTANITNNNNNNNNNNTSQGSTLETEGEMKSTIESDVIDLTYKCKLMNGWDFWGGNYGNFKVYKQGNVVHLQGCLRGKKLKSVITVLPTECRPSGMMTFMFDQHQNKNGRLRIYSNGNIIPEYMSQHWVYLDGISFISSNNDNKLNNSNDITPKLLNGWCNWGQHYTNFKVYKMNNIVYLQGCLKGGIMNSVVCYLPKDCCPSGMITFMFDQHCDKNGRLRIYNDGKIIPEYMSKPWIYLDGFSFVCSS